MKAKLSSTTGSITATPFTFMTLNGYCHNEFLEPFDIQKINLPVVIAYSVAKNKFAVFRNSFSEVGTLIRFYYYYC